ncbi:trypsin-like peptidase domain-containing protein [Aquicoccus sp.]|uniref:trypsin-like peptidase domain-containing protein n=1 Tax=Aquicoccus sp. TaxID=2055851 RepID=UPI00356836DC
MIRQFHAVFIVLFLLARPLAAQQDVAWVQVEAKRSLAEVQERIRAYDARLPDVNGFALGGGWYGIVLGPYTEDDAERVLRVYRAEGEIPRDSFITRTMRFRQQFWPVGANLLNLPELAEPEEEVEAQAAETEPEPQLRTIDETPAEARRSEAALSRDERMELQEMLKWAGVYTAAIDGAFGRGTRGAMAAWQRDNGHEPTGVLTTMQRDELERQYNAILDGLDLELVREDTAGIEMAIPTGVVAFTAYKPPFVHFDASGELDAKVLMISQPGDQNTLFGLYDIMQTLEIVPETGPRERDGDSFVLTGQDDRFTSHTEARLQGGEIKGFTLVWPRGDEERRTRLLDEMRESFRRLEGVMSPAEGVETEQNIDLVSGLEIRRPNLSRSGFFVDGRGTVVTTVQAVDGCEKITFDNRHEAELLGLDEERGIAVLRARESLAPARVAALREGDPRLQSEVAVSGFSYEGRLGAPTLTFGTLSDIKGLQDEPELKRLALSALPGDSGGPVMDTKGAVFGMLLPPSEDARKLPGDVHFAADAATIRRILQDLGITAQSGGGGDDLTPEALTDHAAGMTVLVNCW